ncbi:MAG TPA: hypothetical protein VNZ53_04205 [Steroidobacteraceae bacterium]|jgi:hypothetical protein|nr:hypothetical protein [Steroidobacteraceae bacterium]
MDTNIALRGLDQVPIPARIRALGDVLDEHEREHEGSDIPTVYFQKFQPYYPTYWGELHDYRVGLQQEFCDAPIEQFEPHHLDIAKQTHARARERLALLRSLGPRFYSQREMFDAVQAEAFAEFICTTLLMYQEWEARDAAEKARDAAERRASVKAQCRPRDPRARFRRPLTRKIKRTPSVR